MFGDKIRSRSAAGAIFCLLIGLFIVQSLFGIVERSPTIDEFVYLGLGDYLLENRTWDIQGSLLHPPLSYYIHGIPFFPLDIDEKIWSLPAYERAVLLLNASPDEKILLQARIMIILVGTLLGFFIFRWSCDLFGISGGLLALFLFTFDPNMLAHAGLITPDMVLTCFSFIAAYSFWKLLVAPGVKNAVFTGVSFGLALLSKFTAILLIPIFLILYVFWLVKSKKLLPGKEHLSCSLFVIFFVFFVLAAGYGFQFEPVVEVQDRPHNIIDRLLSGHQKFKPVAYSVVEHLYLPFKPYLRGIASQWTASNNWAGINYLMGEYSREGFWQYYLVAFLIKTPIPLIVIFVLAVWAFIRENNKFEVFTGFFLLLPILAIPLFFSLIGRINIGLRYILPIYPFIYVFSAGVLRWSGFRKKIILYGFLTIMGSWYILGSASIHPSYLAYFNESIGGPENGYHYLVNSNLNWGQDVKKLAKYLKQKNVKHVYWGATDFDIDPLYYGIDSYIPLPGRAILYDGTTAEPDAGKTEKEIIAISANRLPMDLYRWLDEYSPMKTIGFSIYLYDITGNAEAHYQLGLTYLSFLSEVHQYMNRLPKLKVFATNENVHKIRTLAIKEFQRALALDPGEKRYLDKLVESKKKKNPI